MAAIDSILVDASNVSKSALRAYLGAMEWITTATTKTVGSGGDFATLAAALDWAQTKRFAGTAASLKISLLAGNHTLNPYDFDHPDASKITIEGQALTGAFPTVADMTGTKATDKALVEGRFPARIVIDCPGAAKYGLALVSGIKLKNVALMSNDNVRYSLTIGAFSASWQTGTGAGTLTLDNVAFFGGVWSILATNAWVTNASNNGFFWHVTDGGTPAGGPFLLRHGHYQSDTNGANKCYIYSPDALYGFDVDNGASVRVTNCLTLKGTKQAFHVRGSDCYVDAGSCTFSNGEILATVERGAYVNLAGSTVSTFVATSSTQTQEEWSGNGGALKAIVSVGHGANVNIDHCTFTGCQGNYLGYVGFSGSLTGLVVVVTGSKWSVVAIENSGGHVYLDLDLSSPLAGSSDVSRATVGGFSKMTGSTGLTYSPAANTESANGAWMVV